MSVAIIDRIKKGELWDFPGGVYPEQHKHISNQQPINRIALPDLLYIPVKQHVGVSGKICVQKGDEVLKGQALSSSSNPFSVPVHAPTSGEVVDIKEHTSAHPSGLPEMTILLKPDGKEKWIDLSPVADYQSYDRARLAELICSAGISGMGGAGFPTHIKVSSSKEIEFLIINGIECEPYITSDDRLMREHAWQIRQGIDVLSYILQPQHIILAVEDNKPEAIEALKIAIQDNDKIILSSVPTKYPAGGEKQLIQVLTGKEVPANGLPVDIGTMMFNVGTCFAVADAVFAGKPLIERVVTLTGNALTNPQNVWALFGTPVGHLMDYAGYQTDKQDKPYVVMGGPMMGFAVHDHHVPIIKTSNCILVPERNEVVMGNQEQACIRCGACADACPAGLLPQQLYWHSKGGEWDKAREHNLFDCIECGACAYVCPSSIPLVHYYRKAKADIRIQEEEQRKAEKARERFESRKQRLENEKRAREEKAKQAAEARAARQETQTQGDAASSRVAAALARAKAKKQQENLSEEPEQTNIATPSATENSEDTGMSGAQTDKKQKVAEAIARAKAKKQLSADTAELHNNAELHDNTTQQYSPSSTVTTQPDDVEYKEQNSHGENGIDDKKRRVAEAIARAKAKKQAQQPSTQTTDQASESVETEPSASPSPSDTQRRVAEAIARAKAKKAEKQQKG